MARRPVRPFYSEEDYNKLATALDVDRDALVPFEKRFEVAAWWYWLRESPGKLLSPSKLKKRLQSIESHARALLNALGVINHEDAPDGPGDLAVIAALMRSGESDEEALVDDTAQIGRLLEIIDVINAANDLADRAREAASEAVQIQKLVVPEGNIGTEHLNDWVGAMLELYTDITGNPARTSVGAPGRENEGRATGPLLRFLVAASTPIGVVQSADALRKRVRCLLEVRRESK